MFSHVQVRGSSLFASCTCAARILTLVYHSSALLEPTGVQSQACTDVVSRQVARAEYRCPAAPFTSIAPAVWAVGMLNHFTCYSGLTHVMRNLPEHCKFSGTAWKGRRCHQGVPGACARGCIETRPVRFSPELRLTSNAESLPVDTLIMISTQKPRA